MDRIDLITEGTDLPPEARDIAERIVETRGAITRPFQVLLHAPTLAEHVASLGHVVRSGSSLSDADRELATLATGSALGCAFIRSSHLTSASEAGLSAHTIASLDGDRASLAGREATLASFADELCATGTVSAATYAAALDLLGPRGVVELALTVGYYTMLARVMGAFEAC
ncbi:MAG TPA: carboxymuconolactone decarboxylase family protein [Actinomycetota bacterium]|nr:carboxymuconolactone decarboxylase family protein [Actinomycetota bacterium]